MIESSIIYSLEILPNGNAITGTQNGYMSIWNVTSGSRVYTLSNGSCFDCHTDIIYALEFVNGTQMVASGSRDRKIILWNLDVGEKMYTYAKTITSATTSGIFCLKTLDGVSMASGDGGSPFYVRIWSLTSGIEVCFKIEILFNQSF